MQHVTAWRVAAALFLCVHVAVPAVQLSEPRVARWGWQMFSTARPPLQVKIRYPHRVEIVSLWQILPFRRSEIAPTDELRRRLCRERPEAVRVTLDGHGGPCDR